MHQIAGVVTSLGPLSGGLTVLPLLPDEEGRSAVKLWSEKRPVDVVVGTPQLLANLIRLKRLKTNCVQAVVLDEVDTLLDDSFVEATMEVLSNVNLRGVDASRQIGRREEWLNEVAGEEHSTEHDPATPEAVIDHAQLVLVGATLPVDFQLEAVQ